VNESPDPVSILGRDADLLPESPPEVFADLHLDALTAMVILGREDHDLGALFRRRLGTAEAVRYRQEVARDLERAEVRAAVTAFAAEMRRMRRHLRAAGDERYVVARQHQLLRAALIHVRTVARLSESLSAATLHSAGMRALEAALRAHVAEPAFRRLAGDAEAVASQLAQVTYRLTVSGPTVRVAAAVPDEPDFTAEILQTFERFRRQPAKSYLKDVPRSQGVNHVQAAIVDQVARLHPEPFAELAAFVAAHPRFVDPLLERFDREAQFYLAWLDFADSLRAQGLAFCYPEVIPERADSSATGMFDPVMAVKLLEQGRTVVCNDFSLSGPERILVVTGPNQSGKTAYARCLAQCHHLAALGLPIPASRARLVLSDHILTYFEHGENLEDLAGKLLDDLVRARAMIEGATPTSLLVFNELFTSTTLDDAVDLATEVMRRVIDVGCGCVFVTFIDELASLGPSTVSIVSTTEDSRRTFRLERHPAEGLAYAHALAERHGLGYRTLRHRLGLEVSP